MELVHLHVNQHINHFIVIWLVIEFEIQNHLNQNLVSSWQALAQLKSEQFFLFLQN